METIVTNERFRLTDVAPSMADTDQTTGRVTDARESGASKIARVDVLIAARNCADTIERAVSSALSQDDVRAVIVVDDGSTDDTALRAKRCDREAGRVIVERLPACQGPSAARNAGIEISTAPWLAILDGDDFFLPGRIANLLTWADAWDFIADDMLQVSEDDPEGGPRIRLFHDERSEPSPISLEQFVRGNVSQRGKLRKELGFIKPLIRRSFLQERALCYDQSLRLGEDYALYARALAAGARFLLVPTAGYVSTVRATSLSGRHSKRDLELLRDSDRQLMLAKQLTPSERRALSAHYWSLDGRVQWLAVIEAFKRRSIIGFLLPFFRSPRVSGYLIQCLASELAERSKRAYFRASK
jgi:succinoglycan biosynthesis protein ExoU